MKKQTGRDSNGRARCRKSTAIDKTKYDERQSTELDKDGNCTETDKQSLGTWNKCTKKGLISQYTFTTEKTEETEVC